MSTLKARYTSTVRIWDPARAPVSDGGEYEWFTTVRATHVHRLVELLGGDQDSDVLDLLAQPYSGMGSYELERVIREGDIPVERFVR